MEMKDGDKSAFEKVVIYYQDYIYSLCLGIVRDQYIAADITQETLVGIYQSIGSYHGKGFKTWISRIATNKSIDYIRKRTKEQEKLTSLEDYKEVISISETPEDVFLRGDQRDKLLAVCQSLDSKYSIVLNKYYIDNKSYSTIASEEEISIRTVESRLYRAKTMIKKYWEEAGYDK